MSGSLIKVDEFTISSPVASVILGGGSSGSSGLNASIDSTYDVYMVRFSNVLVDTDGVDFQVRVTTSGTPQTDTNYDRATKLLRADTTFGNVSDTNSTFFEIEGGAGNATGEQISGVIYCFNFNNASEYSFCTVEAVDINLNGTLTGQQGGFVKTTAEANDGLNFYVSSGNISSGAEFVLYGLKK